MPALQGPSDTCLCPFSCSTAAEAHNPLLMRLRHCLLCPLALWIRKVLLWLSDGVSNIDLNSLTWLIPDGSTFTPQPLNSSSHRTVLMVCSQTSWKPAQPTERVVPRLNKLKRRKGRREQKKKKGCLDSLIIQLGFLGP